MRDEALGGLIVIALVIVLAFSLNAYSNPYVTICQGDTEEYYGLFITVSKVDNLQYNASFTVGTAGGDNVTYQNRQIGFYDEINGTKRYGFRLLNVNYFREQCAYFYITTDFALTN